MESQHAECRENWKAAKRNLERARRRLAWEHAKAKAGSTAQIRDENGSILQEPSDNKLIPPVSEETLAEHALFPDPRPTWKKEMHRNQDGPCPNPNTPEREGGTLAGPESQRQKIDENVDTKLEDRHFCGEHCTGFRDADTAVNIAEEDIAQACEDPTRGWPGYTTFFPIRQPTDILRNPVFMAEDFRPLGPRHGWVHGEPFDPQTGGVQVAGARCVKLRDFRALGADFKMERPLANRNFTGKAHPEVGITGAWVCASGKMPREPGSNG